jgi:hypothetical protein
MNKREPQRKNSIPPFPEDVEIFVVWLYIYITKTKRNETKRNEILVIQFEIVEGD